MAVAKVCGIETEYGIIVRGDANSNPIAASSTLVNAYVQGLGSEVGRDHDPHLLGEETHLEGAYRQGRLQGQQLDGPSRSQTIATSAERGFASQSYRRVFSDYSTLQRDAIEGETIPFAQRGSVKRYFQLIKPRE